MNKAIFLDRDGIINREMGKHTFQLKDFEILPGVIDAVKKANELGYLVIVITNQSGIVQNMYTHNDVVILHDYFISKLKVGNTNVTDIYYCPHHNKFGKCLCRKPDSLLLEKAIARYNIDISKSYFIGDKERDVLAGEKAGVKGVLVEANRNLYETLNSILKFDL